MNKKIITDMTKGNVWHHLVKFTLPLIWGNLFQLLYNFVDTLVIGRFAEKDALAAVGTCDPIMTLLILGTSGVCIGASVLMSNFFGAGDSDKLREEMQVTVEMGMAAALLVMTVGVVLSMPILHLLQVPAQIQGQAVTYLRIIFLGMPFTCLYNIYAAALRSVGDSKTPLHYLIISSAINMGLDVILVAFFHMGVMGAGMATVFAEAISVFLCIRHVEQNVPLLHVNIKKPSWNRELMLSTLRYGGLSALQQCSQPIGNLIIQGTVNTLGVSTIAAFNVAKKIEDIGLVPGRSISNSMMTFTAQNEGANLPERTEEGFRMGMLLEFIAAILIGITIFTMKKPFIMMFTSDQNIIQEGMKYFSFMAFFYFLPSFTNGHQGYFRGVKAMKTVLLGTLTQITFRTLTSLYFVPHYGIIGVGLGCVIGWSMMFLWQAPYRLLLRKQKSMHNKA